ncbi:aldehyde dehydrogenase [Pisolithus orientalis]|uniref:aldehyde dehydrogenase n=1 Tax=Pisolithus orientalis TaxID=936130 RepID=UPI002225ADE6|nr:aldehyde dehydrogenase [Pisolithus orientalis]KAI6000378.1 aldehyde dehydrogenase [Pisolithus orientalis]
MPSIFTHEFNTPVYKGKVSFNTGLFINGQFVDGSGRNYHRVSNDKVITSVSEGTSKDVDLAVDAAEKAFETTWGLNCPGNKRGLLLNKLASLMEEHTDELAALEALDNGKAFNLARSGDVTTAIDCIRYFAGWTDKISGRVIETTEERFTYTRHEPIGVVGQIIPWNSPPQLSCLLGRLHLLLRQAIRSFLKPSEFTPLTAIRMCHLVNEAGFPPGVLNVVTGYGNTVGSAISSHMRIHKVAFTGSTLAGRKIMEAAAKSNLKNVTLELGGKSPNIIFNDADLEQAVNWARFGAFYNQGQSCVAGSRIFVQEGIYDEFLKRFTEKTRSIKGPQISKIQYDRIMNYIDSGKKDGAKIHTGGERHGNEGYFIQPTIFLDAKPDMRIFKDEEDVVRQANDTVYGLAAAVFTKDVTRAITTAHKLKAGSLWVNCYSVSGPNVPFGGFKQSGIGREMGEYALNNYTEVKAVHVNLGMKMM